MTAYILSVVVLLGTIVSSKALNPALEMYFNKMSAKYNSKLDLNRLQEDIPVVGILTMPRDDRDFPFKHFNWEHNINFVQYAGSYAAVIKYDESDETLYPLLDSLNGVYFTGGALKLFDAWGEPHPYYRTAKKIFDYALQENDNGRHFPLFGICQGFEILHLLANNDDFADTMTNVDIYSQSRRLTFMDLEPKTSSRLLFKDFPEELLEKMAARNLALHAHDWVISIDAYNRKQQLRDFYKILATDTFVDPLKDHQVETFVMAVEARDYPIAGVMFHPETQTIAVHSEDKQALKGKINNADTDAIMYYFSDYLTRQAKISLEQGIHRFEDNESAQKALYLSAGIDLHLMYTSKVMTYGVN